MCLHNGNRGFEFPGYCYLGMNKAEVKAPSVRIKFGENINTFPLKNVARFERFLIRLITRNQQLIDLEISITTPRNESTSFIFERGTFQSRLVNNDFVVLSQYGVDFYNIYPTINEEYYVVDIKKSGKLFKGCNN